jgi:hypothetical protein
MVELPSPWVTPGGTACLFYETTRSSYPLATQPSCRFSNLVTLYGAIAML